MSDRLNELRDFVRTYDRDLRRDFDFEVESVRVSGNPDKKGTYYVRGTAAVFNKWSLDLGGFRERIAPGAFDVVLRDEPHVVHVWDHDTSRILASTRNGTLKLEADADGLHYDSEVAPTSYAADLRILLERGDIDQSSFAFTVPEDGDEWRIAEDDVIERTVTRVDGLYDVTTCAMGAYPQTQAALAARSLASGKRQLIAPPVGEPKEVAPETVGTPRAEDKTAADKAEIMRLKRFAEAETMVARERFYRTRKGAS